MLANSLVSIFSQFAIELQRCSDRGHSDLFGYYKNDCQYLKDAAIAFIRATNTVRIHLEDRSLSDTDKLLALQVMRSLCDLWMSQSPYNDRDYWTSDPNIVMFSQPNYGTAHPDFMESDLGKAWKVCVETLVNDELREEKPYFNYSFDFRWQACYAANLSFQDAASACVKKLRQECFTY